MLEIVELFSVQTQEKMFIQFLKIISLILKLKDREFIMEVEKYIKVLSKLKVVISFMVLLEFNQESYQFQDLLVIFKQNFQNMKEIQKC